MNAVIGWVLLIAEALAASACLYCAAAYPDERAFFVGIAAFNTFAFAIVAITLARRS